MGYAASLRCMIEFCWIVKSCKDAIFENWKWYCNKGFIQEGYPFCYELSNKTHANVYEPTIGDILGWMTLFSL